MTAHPYPIDRKLKEHEVTLHFGLMAESMEQAAVLVKTANGPTLTRWLKHAEITEIKEVDDSRKAE